MVWPRPFLPSTTYFRARVWGFSGVGTDGHSAAAAESGKQHAPPGLHDGSASIRKFFLCYTGTDPISSCGRTQRHLGSLDLHFPFFFFGIMLVNCVWFFFSFSYFSLRFPFVARHAGRVCGDIGVGLRIRARVQWCAVAIAVGQSSEGCCKVAGQVQVQMQVAWHE